MSNDGNKFWSTNSNQDDEAFSDIPEEVNNGVSEIPIVQNKRAAKPKDKPKELPKKAAVVEKDPEYGYEGPVDAGPPYDEDEDFRLVLADARLRLEQGKLYELIMNHDLFEGVEADPRAVKHVQREIRNFAKECMEVMLGMRQTIRKPHNTEQPQESGLFNGLEIETLKALASVATKGMTKQVQEEPKRTGLNPINRASNTNQKAQPITPKKSVSPIKRALKTDLSEDEIEQILAEEGVSREEFDAFYRDYRPLEKPLSKLSTDELLERNRRAKSGLQAKAKNALPMPSNEQLEQTYINRANEASSHPQMQMILNLINSNSKK